MGLTEENTADKLGLKELREMGRDEIAELVAAGLLPADLAAEIQSENEQKKETSKRRIIASACRCKTSRSNSKRMTTGCTK